MPPRPFAAPGDLREEELCRISYQRAVDGCPTYLEHFKDGDEIPARLCTIHPGSLKQRARRTIESVLGALGQGIKGIFTK